jgi:hypothetical protein
MCPGVIVLCCEEKNLALSGIDPWPRGHKLFTVLTEVSLIPFKVVLCKIHWFE